MKKYVYQIFHQLFFECLNFATRKKRKLSHDVAAMQGKESGTVGHILKAINFSRENEWTHNAESTKIIFQFRYFAFEISLIFL